MADSRSQANFNFPDFQIGNDIGTEIQSATLLTTKNFKVSVVRDNQKVPGILEVTPTNEALISWKDLDLEHHIELNRIQRLCESLLIDTFHSRADEFKADDEHKILINAYARELRNADGINQFKLRIYPRYANGQRIVFSQGSETPTILESDSPIPAGTTVLKDPAPGKPFEYTNPVKPNLEVYSAIVSSLRNNLPKFKNIDNSKLENDQRQNHDKCFNCKHPQKHVDQAGLMQVAIKVEGQLYEFNLALDARDQTHAGRGYIIPNNHVSSLRHSPDLSIGLLHKIGDCYQRAAEAFFNSEAEHPRTYDRAVLMNLYKAEEGGPHVHLHMVPRSPSNGYSMEYPMLAKDYIPLINDAAAKKRIVDNFALKLANEISKEPAFKNMEITFPYLSYKHGMEVTSAQHGAALLTPKNGAGDSKTKEEQPTVTHVTKLD